MAVNNRFDLLFHAVCLFVLMTEIKMVMTKVKRVYVCISRL